MPEEEQPKTGEIDGEDSDRTIEAHHTQPDSENPSAINPVHIVVNQENRQTLIPQEDELTRSVRQEAQILSTIPDRIKSILVFIPKRDRDTPHVPEDQQEEDKKPQPFTDEELQELDKLSPEVIKGKMDAIPEENLQAQAQADAALKEAKEILLQKIQSLHITSPEETRELDTLLVRITVSLQTAKSEYDSIASSDGRSANLHEIYIQKRLNEAGYISFDDVDKTIEEISDKVHDLEKRLLGGLRHRKEIAVHKKELRKLLDLGTNRSSPYISNYVSYYDIEELARNTLSAGTNTIIERYGYLSDNIKTTPQEVNPETETLLQDLEDEFINQKIEEYKAFYSKMSKNSPDLKELSDPLNIDEAKSLIHKNNPVNTLINENEIQSLPGAFIQIVRNCVNRNISQSNKYIVEFIKKYGPEMKTPSAPELYLKVLEDIKEKISDEAQEKPEAWRIISDTNHIKEFSKNKSTDQAIDQFVLNFDAEMWEILRNNPEAKRILGEQNIKNLDSVLSHKIVEKLTGIGEGLGSGIHLGQALFHFANKKSIPIAILNSYREYGHSGEYPFITPHVPQEDTELCKYITSLPEGIIEELREENIPGLIDLIDLIRKNPTSFRNSIRQDDEIEEWRPEDVGTMIDQNLIKMSTHYFREGDDKMKLFTLGLLRNIKPGLGDIYTDLSKILQESENTELTSKTISVLQHRVELYHDRAALELISDTIINSTNSQLVDMSLNSFSEISRGIANNYQFVKDHPDIKSKQEYESMTSDMENTLKNVLIKPVDFSATAIRDILHTGFYLNLTSQEFNEFIYSDRVKDIIGEIIKLDDHFIPRMLLDRWIQSNDQESLTLLLDGIAKAQDLESNIRLNTLLMSQMAAGQIENFVGNEKQLNEDNCMRKLSAYVMFVQNNTLMSNNEIRKEVLELFNDPVNKDISLKILRKKYMEFLNDKDTRAIPSELQLLISIIHENQGAGHLRYIESYSNLLYGIRKKFQDKNTTNTTKNEIQDGLYTMEMIFQKEKKEKWSDSDRAVFYDISTDIISAAPSLYTDFLDLFSELSPKELKDFYREQFSLHQAELVVFQALSQNGSEKPTYDIKKLLEIRENIRNFKNTLKESGSNIEQRQQAFQENNDRIVSSIQKGFKERFGLLKIPENFDYERFRSLQNFLKFLGNINRRDPQKENLIAFFLGLKLNGEWEKFRRGEEISTEVYFEGEKLNEINRYLEQRKQLSILTPENLGIPQEQIPEFQQILQEETISQIIGNPQTIDEKLGNIMRNLKELVDEDAYEGKDKKLIEILKRDRKGVGAVLSKTFQEIKGRKVAISPEEIKLREELQRLFDVLEWTPEKVQEIQEHIKVPNMLVNIAQKAEEENVELGIEELQARVIPPESVIAIFNQLGESFKTKSGAIAVSQDLVYLENIIGKNNDRLNTEEKQTLTDYLTSIRDQMRKLEETYEILKAHFTKLKESTHAVNDERLKIRMENIDAVLNMKDTNTPLLGRVTNDPNLIIENIRQCLGCQTKEVNNDTNLTFGDSNKFYLMSQLPDQKGSIADEIAFLLPVQYSNGNTELTFVLDNVYGNKSSDVLVNHIVCLYKKYHQIKSKFPNTKLSIFVSDAAMRSSGLSTEILNSRLEEHIEDKHTTTYESSAKTNIVKSAGGDHYVEFGGGWGRILGEHQVGGLVIR